MRDFFAISLNLLPIVGPTVAAMFIAMLLCVAAIKYFLCRQFGKNDTCGLEAIPQMKPAYPFIGNFAVLLPIKDTIKNARKSAEEVGEIMKFCGANQTCVVLNSAELVQTFLKSGDFGHIAKSHHVYDQFKPFITNGVLVSEGHFWQGQRKILIKSQSFSNLRGYMAMLNKHGRKLVEDLEELYKDKQPKSANFLINRTFLRVITEMITGYDAENRDEIDRYHHNFEVWKEAVINRICKPWLLLNAIWMWSPLKKKHDKAVQEMVEFARRRLEKNKLDRLKFSQVNNNSGSTTFRNVLDELIDAGVDDDQIVDEVNTMMFGGHETGAGAIHSFCFAMSVNPEFQEKCRQEIDALFSEKGETVLTFNDMQGGLKYLERCILETLRLYPPVFIFLRQLKSQLRLVHKGKNIVIPPGTSIAITPFCLHRKPEYYPEPDVFKPDRFLPSEIAKRSAYSYVPFSAGPRNCLGMKFAMIEMKTIAAYILHNFEITTTDKMEEVSLLPYLTITPERDYIFTFRKLL